TITYESFITKFNADLANTLGNLVNRTVAMTNKYFGGKVAFGKAEGEFDNELIACAEETVKNYYAQMDNYHNADACETVMNLAKRCNKYIDETAPWALAKDENAKDRLATVLYNLLECIRMLAVMLTPMMPQSAKDIFAQLCTDNKEFGFGAVKEYSVGEAVALFQRLDMNKVLEEIAAEQKAAAEKEAAKNENVTTLTQISIEDFLKVELKTAKIVKCEPIPKAKKLLKLTLDDGSGKDRIVASGIAKWYTPDDLIGHTVIVVSNLKPAVLCGVESNGMILAADCDEDTVKVVFADDIPAGSRIR
ncbi:MAG: methionine--tRNA ligase subunit beta, partial [Clostridia bacterium]|nr:methionine--tRNA ligase subunit beta [Clostridia bacterium]